MKHLYFLLTVILLMTCTVKAQSQSDYKELPQFGIRNSA